MPLCSERPTPTLAAAESWLRDQLSASPHRWEHSLGVRDAASTLAQRFHLSKNQVIAAEWAGLLHDAAKLTPAPDLLAYCDSHGLPISPAERLSPSLLHPKVGAHRVQTALGLDDPDLLEAIETHTTARPEMGPVAWVVYVADKLERRTRDAAWTAPYWARLEASDDWPVLLGVALDLLDESLLSVIRRRQPIHPDTVFARNALIPPLKRQGAPHEREVVPTVPPLLMEETR